MLKKFFFFNYYPRMDRMRCTFAFDLAIQPSAPPPMQIHKSWEKCLVREDRCGPGALLQTTRHPSCPLGVAFLLILQRDADSPVSCFVCLNAQQEYTYPRTQPPSLILHHHPSPNPTPLALTTIDRPCVDPESANWKPPSRMDTSNIQIEIPPQGLRRDTRTSEFTR